MARVIGFLIGLAAAAHYVILMLESGMSERYASSAVKIVEYLPGVEGNLALKLFLSGPGVIAGLVCFWLSVRRSPTASS